jgi:hypothetical protein
MFEMKAVMSYTNFLYEEPSLTFTDCVSWLMHGPAGRVLQ